MERCEIVRILVNQIQNQDELYQSIDVPNFHVTIILKQCLTECIECKSDCFNRLFKINSAIDYLHDELNTGHWSEVPIILKQAFSVASFIKSLTILQSSIVSLESLGNCLKSLDMGLLLGAPLDENPELLTDSAKYISEEISKLQSSSVEKMTSAVKRKCEESYKVEFCSIKGKVIEVERCPSVDYFNKNYFQPQIPVKLEGCMNHWPAKTKWADINYLLKIAGDRTVPIEIGSHYADENWSQKLMTLKEFITKHYIGDSSEMGYLAQHNLFDQVTELKKDIYVPDYCCLSLDYDKSSQPDVNAWFGPKGTVSPLHHDPKNNILAQVCGTKQLLLFSPEDSQYLYPHEGKMLSNTAQVSPVQPDLKTYPEFKKTVMYKCLLEPEEMLFIPVKWWHHVTALDKSFSVSFWWE